MQVHQEDLERTVNRVSLVQRAIQDRLDCRACPEIRVDLANRVSCRKVRKDFERPLSQAALLQQPNPDWTVAQDPQDQKDNLAILAQRDSQVQTDCPAHLVNSAILASTDILVRCSNDFLHNHPHYRRTRRAWPRGRTWRGWQRWRLCALSAGKTGTWLLSARLVSRSPLASLSQS